MVSHELTLSETPSIFYDQKWKALSCFDCKRNQEVKSRIMCNYLSERMVEAVTAFGKQKPNIEEEKM
ncbi:hypothetical protein H0178_52245 [Cytobacillus firmus]|nr:hypothetical protein [Cytobacillus firmus]